MKIQESAENYLETILMLKNKSGVVRSIDIANELNITKPSVSVAMKHFRENDYISMDSHGYISLTDKGFAIANKMYERHKLLTNWLISLGVDSETSSADACRIEHVISEETFDRIKDFYNKTLSDKK